jgi:poly(A) polymerase
MRPVRPRAADPSSVGTTLTGKKRTQPGRRGGRNRGESAPDGEAAAGPAAPAAPVEAGPGREPVRQAVEIPDDRFDFDTLKIVRRLTRHGHEAYLVGGCVRDLLLDRVPKDFDVATSARPRQIKRLFRNCRIIGRRFKLAHIHFGEKIIEVSTFRRNPGDGGGNGEAGDEDDLLILRDNVYGSAEEDALRRDFTINALFYDVEERRVLDYVGGLDDIRRKRIATIGVPEIRFREDPVRILRAAEFSARLGFRIDPEVAAAMERCGPDIDRAARPRVLEEILQALSSGRAAQVLQVLVELSLLDHVVPEIGDQQDLERLSTDLRTVDEEDGGRRGLSDALLLTFLFRTRIQEEEMLYAADEDGPPINPLEPLEKIFGPFAERMGVSRKNGQRVREIHLGLRRLLRRGARRRLNPTVLVRRAHFPETLAAFRIVSLAENLPLDGWEAWKARLDAVRAAKDASQATPKSPRRRRKKKKRS